MQKIAIITSHDKVSKMLVNEALRGIESTNITLIYDRSNSAKRLYRLIIKKRISIYWLLKNICSRVIQSIYLTLRRDIALVNIKSTYIKNNLDLELLLSNNQFDKIFCFRAGLVINKANVTKANFLNIHCAKIPEYAGLMAIHRAIRNKDYEQECVMHKVVSAIDSGEVLSIKKYTICKAEPYWKVDLKAYMVGAKLLHRELLFIFT